MGLTRRQCQPYGQTIAVYQSMNLAGQSTSRTSHRLSPVLGNASCMLMHTDNGGVDHLDGPVIGNGKRIYDAAPDSRPPPANEPIVAGRVRTKGLRQIAPRGSRSQNPENAIEHTTVIYTRNPARFVGKHRLDCSPLFVGEFVAHDRSTLDQELEPGLGARFDLADRTAGRPLCTRENQTYLPAPEAQIVELT